MQIGREHVLRVIPELRTLFGTLGLNVSPYSDAELVDAVLAVAPVVDDGWLSDEQLTLVIQRLAANAKPAA
jgi:hypothetical protein